ncbi:MAG: hypothetical protein ABJG78_02130 [Cyclobacteriaceae bacterium]
MNFVSIQGRHAPGMQFKGDELHVCHQLMRGLSNSEYLVINSPYRTDILYNSPRDKNQSIIRLWCLHKGKNFEDMLQKFFRAAGSLESLQHYFSRLLLLQRIPTWYNPYRGELDSTLSTNTGELSAMISECLKAFVEQGLFDQTREKPDVELKKSEYVDTLSIVSEVLAKYNSN